MKLTKFAVVSTPKSRAAAQEGEDLKEPWEEAVTRLDGEIVEKEGAEVIVIPLASLSSIRNARDGNKTAKIIAVVSREFPRPDLADLYFAGVAGATFTVSGPVDDATEAESILRDLLRIRD